MNRTKTKQTKDNAYPATAETHQKSVNADALTTNQGTRIADNQNSLKSGERGPVLLEDFILREKITHFDHERIPERIVHARGSAAHGYFQPYKSMSHLTQAAFLSDPAVKTPVFARFSTVAGGAGSGDLARDVRGFSVKFYTSEGNYDLVGNNIPVFFIQDAIKFPDLIHAVKMEPDRGFPQAGSAHDTFWDFISLMPESMHMVMWAMSDRAIPRSLRMMDGFGIHTFRMSNKAGESRFVKFHWRPKLGCAAVLWDEAVKINGADSDFHRRDLWKAIADGDFPEWELGLQIFDQAQADSLDFDVLDPTKLIPEELIPVEMVGKMVLDRNPDNFFAETEQVAFCPANLVAGIDVTEDPLLQGRLFSYLDTQLSRLGGPNFQQLPVNRPKCPFQNLQRDGHMQTNVPVGRVAYEPNSLDPTGPRETDVRSFRTIPAAVEGNKLRLRPASFADHYSQARLFYRSVSDPEQLHIRQALVFELGKVETVEIRRRMLGHLEIIDAKLAEAVSEGLGMEGQATRVDPFTQPIDLPTSPALRLYGRTGPTLHGRAVGVLLGAGFDNKLSHALIAAIEKSGAKVAMIALKAGGVEDSAGKMYAVDMALAASPSVFFDAVAVIVGRKGDEELSRNPDALSFLRDAYRHLKAIGLGAAPLLTQAAGIPAQPGVVELGADKAAQQFIQSALTGRFWERQP
jgi:catalase